jgi:hypothetical protein
VLVAAVLVAAIAWSGLLRNGWYWLTRNYTTVTPVSATVAPPGVAAPGSDPAALIDGKDQEFTMNWTSAQAPTCQNPAQGTWITLTLKEPTHIRRLLIYPGLAPDRPDASSQPRPKKIVVRFQDQAGPTRGCLTRDVVAPAGDKRQPAVLNVDSRGDVTQVFIGVTEINPPSDPSQVSITDLRFQAYPR